MFSPAGRSDVTQTVMSAFSIKRTLDLIVFERLLSSESGHSTAYVFIPPCREFIEHSYSLLPVSR